MKIANPTNRLPRFFNFLREVKGEGKRVNWPTREKTIKDTAIVLLFSVVVAAFLSIFDFVFQKILDSFLI